MFAIKSVERQKIWQHKTRKKNSSKSNRDILHFGALSPPDGPAVVRVNIFVRSISKIDDVTM
ncbi:unnamed protein product, partial [Nesidiocoris tenuis]